MIVLSIGIWRAGRGRREYKMLSIAAGVPIGGSRLRELRWWLHERRKMRAETRKQKLTARQQRCNHRMVWMETHDSSKYCAKCGAASFGLSVMSYGKDYRG